MKLKVLLATAVTLVALSLANAGDGPQFGTPRGGPQALATADYGGVWYSTACRFGPPSVTVVHFSTIVASGKGVFYGAVFSTGSTANFLDVYDSTSADVAVAEGAITRLYNVGSSTGGVGAFAVGFSGPAKPIRFSQGLIVRPSGSANDLLNLITVLYYREPDKNSGTPFNNP